MGLTVALNNALTGLNVNQQALTVLSQNIANANTAGYSKQIVSQQSIYLDGVGEGVNIDSITRKVDEYLTRAVQGQLSSVGQASVINDYHSRLQLMLGTPGGQNSIDSYINGFFNSLQSLSQTPDNTTLQRLVTNNADTLTTQIRDLSSNIQGLQFEAENDIGLAVSAVNNDIKEIHDLNKLIAQNFSLGKSVAELEDRRDKLVGDISQYIDVNSFIKDGNKLFLTTAGGISILDDSVYALSYKQVTSQTAFSGGTNFDAITVAPVDDTGTVIGSSQTLVTGGQLSGVTTVLTSGKMAGLLQLRGQILPDINSQLDNLTATLRDQVNAIQNAGSGFPGANSLTGTRAVFGQDYSDWTGSVRIAVLDQNGQPLPSLYNDEPNGLAPLTLDLGSLDSGYGLGKPSTQGIIDAINQYYGVPQNKAEVGNLNNIQLVADTAALPNSGNSLSFDFNLNNISDGKSSFFVTGLQVKDNLGADITSITQNAPSVALSAVNTYVTTAGSGTVVVNTAPGNNFAEGQTVYLSLPSAPVDGIPAANLSGFFKITNVTGSSFQIDTGAAATAGGSFSEAGMTASPSYSEVQPGETVRTSTSGVISANVSGNTTTPFYDVTATVAVIDADGNISNAVITYRVPNNQPALTGRMFGAQSVAGSATLVPPSSLRPVLTASLVDANGKEIPKANGLYINSASGYLKLQAGTSSYTIAIDSLDSKELGKLDTSPPTAGTNRGFSHYFELNNFFKSYLPTPTGDTVSGSALNFGLESRIKNNPGLISLGNLTRAPDSISPGIPPNYTYRLTPGNNSVIAQLSGLTSKINSFAAIGGLGATTQTFAGYMAQVIGTASTNAAAAKSNSDNADALLQGYTLRSSAVSGVNLDTELANTVIYQNAYAASARIITVANSLFDDLLQSFR